MTKFGQICAHERHPIPRPYGRAMGCLSRVTQREMTAIYRERTVVCCHVRYFLDRDANGLLLINVVKFDLWIDDHIFLSKYLCIGDGYWEVCNDVLWLLHLFAIITIAVTYATCCEISCVIEVIERWHQRDSPSVITCGDSVSPKHQKPSVLCIYIACHTTVCIFLEFHYLIVA